MKILSIIIIVLTVSYAFAENGIELFLKADSLSNLEIPEERLECYQKLSEANPENGSYSFSLGYQYFSLGEHGKSIKAFKAAQNLGWFYDSSFMLAKNYTLINQPDSAIYYLNEYIKSPFKGPPIDLGLADSIFTKLHHLPGFIELLPPEVAEDEMQNWRNEIDYMSRMFKITHYDPFWKMSETEWDGYIEQLKQDIPVLSTNQILTRIYQFIAMIGDGHTMVLTMGKNEHRFQAKKLPFYTTIFSDGCFVTEATEDYKDLLGAKIVGINEHDYEDIYQLVSTLIPRDNEKWINTLFNKYFTNATFLNGLGICDSADSLKIRYNNKNITKTMIVKTHFEKDLPEMLDYHAFKGTEAPLFKAKDDIYWHQYHEKERILYFQFNQVWNLEDKPLDAYCDSLKKVAEDNEISAFVFDIRNNTGGNSENNKIILKLLTSEKINIFGKLFVLIGNRTFSAAQNLTSDIENYTDAIFLGQHTGSKPNFIGEVNFFQLPYSRLQVSSSNLYHQRGNYSADKRNWIAPDVFIEYSSQDYKNGVDRVMKEILEFVE